MKASGSQLSLVSTILTHYVRVAFVGGIRGWHRPKDKWHRPKDISSTVQRVGGTVRG
jgi:hypothetical protein